MPTPSSSAGTLEPEAIPFNRRDWRGFAAGGVLAVAALVVYSGTFSAPLLFDDHPTILGNASIRHWSTAFWPPGGMTASGRPILNLSLALNYAISGTALWSYHAVNLLIHILAGWTLFGIVRHTCGLVGRVVPNPPRGMSGPSERRAEDNAPQPTDATLLAFFVALLWTLHPLQTESVTYLVQRAESLMGLFYLLTLYAFIRGAETTGLSQENDAVGPILRSQFPNPNGVGRPRPTSPIAWIRLRPRLWFWCSATACLLGMGTKEVMVSAPLIVLLYDRTFLAGSFREAWRQRWKLHVALAATWLPLIGLAAAAGWNRGGTSGLSTGVTPWAYWQTQFEAITRYIGLSVWPHPLVFEYGTFWVGRMAEVGWYALAVVALAVAVVVGLWRRSVPGFLGAWFFVILAPTSVMPGGIQMIVEHRMYLPLAAVMAAVVLGIHAAVRRKDWLIIAALVFGLGALTARRNEDYRSALSLWGDTVAKRPQNVKALVGLGVALTETPGRLNDAIAEFRQALRLQPDNAEAHYNLGNALARVPGRLPEAVAEYEAALHLQPDSAVVHSNLGVALSQLPGRHDGAIAHFQEAVRLKPDYAPAYFNLGKAFAQQPGRLPEAIAQYETALRLQPDWAEAHAALGSVFLRMPARLRDAVAQCEAAVRLRPDLAPGWTGLGLARMRLGDQPAAIAAFQEALRRSPEDRVARQALAALSEQAGNP
jgi:tetratricopeptide (TPR) repeat protein